MSFPQLVSPPMRSRTQSRRTLIMSKRGVALTVLWAAVVCRAFHTPIGVKRDRSFGGRDRTVTELGRGQSQPQRQHALRATWQGGSRRPLEPRILHLMEEETDEAQGDNVIEMAESVVDDDKGAANDRPTTKSQVRFRDTPPPIHTWRQQYIHFARLFRH